MGRCTGPLLYAWCVVAPVAVMAATAVLSAGCGSTPALDTLVVVFNVPGAEMTASTRTVALSPLASVPKAHVTVPRAVQSPRDGIVPTTLSPVGMDVALFTNEAPSGP